MSLVSLLSQVFILVYEGINVLFNLPLDKNKADFEKVKQFLEERYGDNYIEEMKKIEISVKAQKYLEEQYKGEYTKDEMKNNLQQYLDQQYSGFDTEEIVEEIVETILLLKSMQEGNSDLAELR